MRYRSRTRRAGRTRGRVRTTRKRRGMSSYQPMRQRLGRRF